MGSSPFAILVYNCKKSSNEAMLQAIFISGVSKP
jgi:hypothetical protein